MAGAIKAYHEYAGTWKSDIEVKIAEVIPTFVAECTPEYQLLNTTSSFRFGMLSGY